MAFGQRTAISIIILLASLMIGSIVFSQLSGQAKTIATNNNDTAASNFISQVESIGWNGLQLVGIGAIVLAAVFILGMLGFMGGGGAV